MFLVLALVASNACSVPFDALTAAADVSTRAASIVIDGASSLTVGQTTKLTIVVKDAENRVLPDLSIALGNSAPAVASIAPDGTVTALSAGTVTFTAVSGAVQGSKTLTVTPAGTTPPPTTPPPTTPPPSGAPSSAQLPSATVETTMPAAPAPGGTTISVAAGADLQAAINQAKPGDVIELAAGATYTGNFVLPDKGPSTSWIVIRPASSVTLPPEGKRMTPQIAAALSLPRIVSAAPEYAISTALTAHHYRLIGLEIGVAASVGQSYGLVGLGDADGTRGQTTDAAIAHHLVLDRTYIHGNPTQALRRCIALNSASTAIIDSWIDECHDAGFDSQAIGGWNGSGPYKIVNNYLSAGGEIVMFGGADPAVLNLVPSDIEIRHNHLTRPLSWKGKWTVKNLFELKNARRVLVEGNVMENNWLDGQEGQAIVLKSVNQGNTAPWSGTTDVTFRLNIIRNAGSGFHLAASPEPKPAVHMQRVEISNNLMYNINPTDYRGAGRGVMTSGDLTDVVINHNTILAGGTNGFTGMDMDGYDVPVTVRFKVTNNIFGTVNGVGLQGQTTGFAGPTWTYFAPDGTIGGNVWAVGQAYSTGYYASYSALDRLVVNDVTTFTSLGFTNAAAGDFTLTATSPAKGQAIGGGDAGADIAAIRNATNGVIIP